MKKKDCIYWADDHALVIRGEWFVVKAKRGYTIVSRWHMTMNGGKYYYRTSEKKWHSKGVKYGSSSKLQS